MPTILILGAASDISVAAAGKYASKGYHLQLAARNCHRLAPLQSDLSIKYSVSVTLFEFDALDYNSHQHFFDELPVKPDVTLCVFGYLGDNETARNSWEESARIMHTNYTGAVSVLNVVSNYYAAQKSGTIIGISSVAGVRGRQSNYIYGSAKAGFTTYLSGLRNRMFHENVHVLTVLPGFVDTSMTADMSLPPLLTAKPEEVAEAVFNAARSKKNIIYVKWFWRWIMLIISCIPEFLFKKLKL